MTINATLMGQLIVLAMILFAGIGYYLGKRKTGSPWLTALSLGISCLIPVVAIVYLIVLICKPDRPQPSS